MAEKGDELILQRIVEKVEDNNLIGLCLVLQNVSSEKRREIISKTFWNETPLHTACRKNYVTVSEFLLKNCGADVNQVSERDNVQTTPLFIAVEHCGPTLIKALIRRGSDVHWKNSTGQNALVKACQWKLPHNAYVLLKNKVQINSEANMKLCLDSTDYYIRSLTFGTDSNWSNEKGNTLFLEASRTNNFELMELLWKQKINPYHRNNEGANALDIALLNSNEEIFTKLITTYMYMKADEILSYEYCGARLILYSSNFEMAKTFWLKSVELRQNNPGCIEAKNPLASTGIPLPITEFVSEEDVQNLNKEDLPLQALLVCLRILTSLSPATHKAFSSVVGSKTFTLSLKKSFVLAKKLFSFPWPGNSTACPAAMAMSGLIKLYYTHVDIASRNYWTTVAVFINLVNFIIDDVWRLLTGTGDRTNWKYFVLFKELLNIVLTYLNVILEFGLSDDLIDKRMECLVSKFTQRYPTSLLHVALSRNCKFKVVVYLLKCKARLDTVDEEGNLPIHLALSRYPETDERYKVAVHLICAGSSIDKRNKFDLIPRIHFLSMK